jgi:hypothetical protein
VILTLKILDLYGKLVTEWLSADKTVPDVDIDMTDGFEEVPGAKRLEARSEWEKVVFDPMNIDVQALQEYLHILFITGKKDAANAIQDLRNKAQRAQAIQRLKSTMGYRRLAEIRSLEQREARRAQRFFGQRNYPWRGT